MGPVLHADRFADGQLPVNDDSGGRIERFDPEPARRSTNGGLSEQFSSRVVGRCASVCDELRRQLALGGAFAPAGGPERLIAAAMLAALA